MQIELPYGLVSRVQSQAALLGASEADDIRRALDSLDWMEGERRAVREGIDAWRAGDFLELGAFDAEFRARNGIEATK